MNEDALNTPLLNKNSDIYDSLEIVAKNLISKKSCTLNIVFGCVVFKIQPYENGLICNNRDYLHF